MSIVHRFQIPDETNRTGAEIKFATSFDLHVSVGDYVEFEALPGKNYRVEKKQFLISLDETIDRVDYETSEVKS